ncbi:MAG: STAS domain-containing protein [Bacteroidia bacterium]|nr:STAS domain-containing protein [Bacteroidia bacterium]
MEIKEQRHEEYVTLTPVGDLDANSSVVLDEKIQEMLEAGDVHIHIDGSELPYISSAGLGVFVSHLDGIQNVGGSLVISGLNESVQDVFSLLGLDQLLTIVNHSEEAAQMFTKS